MRRQNKNVWKGLIGCCRSGLFVPVLVGSIIVITLAFSSQVSAQAPAPKASPQVDADPVSASSDPDAKKDDDDDPIKKPKRGSLIIAPIPITSPTFGSGLILGVGYVFKLNQEDKTSPPSSVGIAGAFTSSGSRGIVLGGRFYFSENKYQTAFAIGKGRANYDYYGIGRVPGSEGVVVEMKQSGSFFFAEFMRNFGKKIFVGPRYQYRKLTAALGGVPGAPGGFEIPEIDITSTTAAIGIHVQRDLRDNTFYPRKGSLFDFKADFFGKAIGSNRNYQTYAISYNGYHSLGKKQVLAYRGMACSVSERAPFFDLCLYGSSDLRGYTTGEFQDRRKFATQVEFRQELPYRLGIVGFAGVGGVAPKWDKFQFNKLLPAAGIGLRFKLDKTNHINYRIDLGFGRNGHTLALSVTEAF